MTSKIHKAIIENDLLALDECINEVDDFLGNGPFHLAVLEKNEVVLDYLISEHGEYINQLNSQRETPLIYALSTRRRTNLAKKLILAGADINIRTTDAAPLHLAVEYPELVELLLERGADPNSIGLNDQTPLHRAVQCSNIESACALLYYNADSTIPDDCNCTPFMAALQTYNSEMQELLFEYVDDFSACSNKASLLFLAIAYGSSYSEEIILRGADINVANSKIPFRSAVSTTLHFARTWGRLHKNTFEIIWAMDYQHQPPYLGSILVRLCELDTEDFLAVIGTLMESEENFPLLVQSSLIKNDFFVFIRHCGCINWPLETFSKFFYTLLSYGYSPTEDDLAAIYNHWGYCEILKFLFHTDIRDFSLSDVDKIPIKLMYNVQCSSKELLNRLVLSVKEESCHFETKITTLAVFRVLQYFLYPPLLRAYAESRKIDGVSLKIDELSTLPSLVELARNQTREDIRKSNKVTNSCQLYTLINNLDVPDDHKKILTFERSIYKPKIQFPK